MQVFCQWLNKKYLPELYSRNDQYNTNSYFIIRSFLSPPRPPDTSAAAHS